MGQESRFLNTSYLFNTLVIKTKALILKLTRGSYPFDYFKDKDVLQSNLSYKLKYQNNYHSLAYLDKQKAERLHSGKRSITQDLILGLVYNNEKERNQKLDSKYLIDLALKLKEKSEYSENEMTFWFDEPYKRFDLKGQYKSGIVQGKAASFYLRCYGLTNEERFKEYAKKCLLSVYQKNDLQSVLINLPNELTWVEEYPSPKPSMVLNGFLFYIIGLAEYLTFESDRALEAHLEICLKSVIAWMPHYRLKGGLLYSMYRWNLCNVHYTGIMKFQFEHLHQLTGIPIFKEYAEFVDEITNWKTFDQLLEL